VGVATRMHMCMCECVCACDGVHGITIRAYGIGFGFSGFLVQGRGFSI
jgi:hypothetical protein